MKDQITPGEAIPVLQEPAPAREFSRRSEELTHEVVVNFYRRMKINRVFPLVVELKGPADKRAAEMTSSNSIQVRPVVPGALVTPASRDVVLGNSDAPTTFYVTPLARGKFRDARVGIYQDGRLLQEVKLPMKVVRQRLTWILLILAFLIPGFIHYFTVGVDLSLSGTRAKSAKAAPISPKMPRAEEADLQALQKRLGKPMPQGAGAAREAEAPTEVASPTLPRGRLEQEIISNTPEPRGEEGSSVNVLGQDFEIPAIRKPTAHAIQQGYESLQDWEKAFNLTGYLFFLLLILTLLSWITHRSQRSRRRAVPAPLRA